MRYFIYAKTNKYKNFHPISITKDGFYIELNNIYATLITDDENDYKGFLRMDKARELLDKLRNTFKEYKFEIRTTQGEKYE